MGNRVTVKQLKVFQAVVRYQSISRASEEIFLSKSAVSAAVNQLEDALGIYLFYRTSKGLRVTDVGRELYERVNNLLDQLVEIEQLGKQDISGKIVIGASPLFYGYILPKLLPQFLNEYPDVDIEIIEGLTSDIVDNVQDFVFDVGFIDGVAFSDDIESIFLKKDYLKIICSDNHPLYCKQKFEADEIFDYPYIVWSPGFGAKTIEIDLAKIGKETLFYKNLVAAHDQNESVVLLEDITFDLENKGQQTKAGNKLIDSIVMLKNPEAVKISVAENSQAIAVISETMLLAVPMLSNLRILNVDGLIQYKKLNMIFHKRKYSSKLLEIFLEWMKDKLKD